MGASNSCAMKASTSVASVINQFSWYYLNHVTGNEGIVEHDLTVPIDTHAQLRLEYAPILIAK